VVQRYAWQWEKEATDYKVRHLQIAVRVIAVRALYTLATPLYFLCLSCSFLLLVHHAFFTRLWIPPEKCPENRSENVTLIFFREIPGIHSQNVSITYQLFLHQLSIRLSQVFKFGIHFRYVWVMWARRWYIRLMNHTWRNVACRCDFAFTFPLFFEKSKIHV